MADIFGSAHMDDPWLPIAHCKSGNLCNSCFSSSASSVQLGMELEEWGTLDISQNKYAARGEGERERKRWREGRRGRGEGVRMGKVSFYRLMKFFGILDIEEEGHEVIEKLRL